MNQRTILIVASIIFTCAACTTAEERAARLNATWDQACRGDRGCVSQMAETYAIERQAQSQRGIAMMGMGLQMMQQSRPQYPVSRMTTCRRMGAFVNCW
jgi:hypothetical protein